MIHLNEIINQMILGFHLNNSLLSAISALSTIVIAVAVAIISYLQWTTNQKKLRLDLYQKRIDIYLRVLNFSEGLSKWPKITEIERETLKSSFIRARNEASFLFPDKSGVHKLVRTFGEKTLYIVDSDSSFFADATEEEKQSHYQKLNACIDQSFALIRELKAKLSPFLSFR